MTLLELTLRLIAGVLLKLTNGFFVAIEFALTRARRFTEAEFVDGNRTLLRLCADCWKVYLEEVMGRNFDG